MVRLQLLLVLTTGALAMLPPTNGFMLVLPATTFDPAATLRWVLPAGGLIVASGPYSGAFVVAGDRAAIMSAALGHGAFVVTARFSGCGTNAKDST